LSRRILFASNWATDCIDSCGAVTEAYVVQYADTSDSLQPTPHLIQHLTLDGVYPNPAWALPSMVYSLRDGASARLELVDLLGRVVMRRDLGAQGPGQHELMLDRSALPPGVCWLRLLDASHVASARIVLLR